MGCDGGTIPRRDELVRTKKRPEQKDKSSELSFRWQHCAISQQPLRSPIVACGLGRLYNKEVVLEGLLDRSTLPELAQHIKSLKHVKDLRLTPNPAYKAAAEKDEGLVDKRPSPHICPVIGLEMNGTYRFVFPWSCGCVVSERALKEVKTSLCLGCQRPISADDVVVLNGGEEDVKVMEGRMEARLAAAKSRRKPAAATASETPGPSTVPAEAPRPGPAGKLKRAAATPGMEDPAFKKTKEGYSIAEDPRATDVFKSLFTSHSSAAQQTRAHWVTYNPFYN